MRQQDYSRPKLFQLARNERQRFDEVVPAGSLLMTLDRDGPKPSKRHLGTDVVFKSVVAGKELVHEVTLAPESHLEELGAAPLLNG